MLTLDNDNAARRHMQPATIKFAHIEIIRSESIAQRSMNDTMKGQRLAHQRLTQKERSGAREKSL